MEAEVQLILSQGGLAFGASAGRQDSRRRRAGDSKEELTEQAALIQFEGHRARGTFGKRVGKALAMVAAGHPGLAPTALSQENFLCLAMHLI